MDFDNVVKAEKAKTFRRYNRFRRIGRLFRAAEVCVAVLFFFWTFTRLPFAVQMSREFLSRIAGVISTPLFVFLIGNCIVVVVLLLTKSSDQTTSANAETDIYEALVRSVPKPSDEEEDIVYDDKQVIVMNESNTPHDGNDGVEIDSGTSSDEPSKVYGRCKSDVVFSKQRRADEDIMMVIHKPSSSSSSSLQRSKTDKCMRISDNNNNKRNYPEDKLSNEEFQKTIEAFIAKQLMFRRQESLAVVVHNKSLMASDSLHRINNNITKFCEDKPSTRES